MKKYQKIKNKILNDDLFATKIQYMLSKVILEDPIKPLKFIYKKYKIEKRLNNKFSIYDMKTNKKLYGGIYFQDVAKYVVDNIKNHGNVVNILKLEKELIRHKDKIEFYERYYQQKRNNNIKIKLNNIYFYYELYRNSILELINNR